MRDSLRATDKHIKILCIGNSILHHPPAPHIGWHYNWGMAASCEENDYYHVLQKLLKKNFPDYLFEFELARGIDFETSVNIFTDFDYFSVFDKVYAEKMKKFMPDIVTFQVGGNVRSYTEDSYCYALSEFVKYCRKFNPDVTVILTETMSEGKNGKINIALRRAAKDMICPYISLYKYNCPDNLALGLFEHPGVASHPGDKGMLEIGKAYFGEIQKIILTMQNNCKISVKAEGEYVEFSSGTPCYVNKQICLPLEKTVETLGGACLFENNKCICFIEDDGEKVELVQGHSLYEKYIHIIEGCVYVSPDFFSEVLGCTVNFIKSTNCIDIYKPKVDIICSRPEIDGALITLADAENKTGGYKIYHGSCNLLFVPNPSDEKDTVFYLESTARSDFPSWTYFWCEATGKFVPGRRYKVSFDIMHTKTVTGYVPDKTLSGINFVYHDKAIPGVFDHNSTPDGHSGEFELLPGKWTHVEYIYTMPDTLDVDKSCSFGIYAYPHNTKEAISFYLDDVSVVPYSGELSDGIVKLDLV